MADLKLKDKFTLNIEAGVEGLWYVTCPDVPGLFVANSSLSIALSVVPRVMRDLRLAAKAMAMEGPSTSVERDDG